VTPFALLLLLGADPVEEKFKDVSIEKEFAPYLRANILLMEVAGAKVIRLKKGRFAVIGVGSVFLADDGARVRIDGEKACKVKALAAIVSEREGVQVAHEETVEDRTVIVLDGKDEKAKSVSKVLSLTKTKTQGVIKGMSAVGRWRSKDGKVLYIAMGAVCDAKGEPIIDER